MLGGMFMRDVVRIFFFFLVSFLLYIGLVTT